MRVPGHKGLGYLSDKLLALGLANLPKEGLCHKCARLRYQLS